MKGFTLIELVIIITLLGILSVVAITYFTSYYPLKLDAAANKLVSDIRYVQQQAITKQVNFGIYFQPANETYQAYRETISNIIADPLTQDDLIVNYTTDEELRDIDLVSTNFSDRLEFNPVGTPYDGTGSVLDYVGQITLTYSGNSRTIKIESNTGKVWIE